ncbi:MAG: IPTL-CTERM sorting domain-containing protein [Pseudomonadota bacterium]
MKKYFIIITLLILSNLANAASQRFDFTFAENLGTATATGFVIFESTLLPNPGGDFYILPNPLVLDLQITVSGSASGDGLYTLNDFSVVIFDTGGIALDFSRELVGQPTDSSPWGTTGGGGKSSATKRIVGLPDFNLLSNQVPPDSFINGDLYNSGSNTLGINLPPSGIDSFTLQASSGENMVIASFAPFAAAVVPTLGSYAIIAFGLLLLLLGFWGLRKRV